MLNRSLRVRPATTAPDLADEILARAPAPPQRGWVLRAALGVVAVAQLALGLSQLLAVDAAEHSHGAAEMAGHLFNESTAWNLALGIGLGWVALRARDAAGLLPVLSGFVLLLVVLSVHDLITGAATTTRVASHGLLVLGLGLLYAVHRQCRDRGAPTPGRPDAATSPDDDIDTDGDLDQPAGRGIRPGRPPLRPASHRRAA
ncbi:putative anti-sigma-YlaC factor YlaD, contains Zn-finger domain [Goodfellowiella coeruleoviolacea]|uniref:Anti-sigma-YlaC factor YlaD, contains Zn-finger domain n=1 Tax=Goodfellowiella coeruleoviolacea TaxID=334858 RepID=A0AAE3KI76_9PSEU|nr:putative anti-sigma-YlaC factor YlaD, contains Zn-finger domain [Goodfellowiella coeruleoviolacea]